MGVSTERETGGQRGPAIETEKGKESKSEQRKNSTRNASGSLVSQREGSWLHRGYDSISQIFCILI